MTPKAEQAPNSAFASAQMRWELMAAEDGRSPAQQRARDTAQDRVVAEKGRGRAAGVLCSMSSKAIRSFNDDIPRSPCGALASLCFNAGAVRNS